MKHHSWASLCAAAAASTIDASATVTRGCSTTSVKRPPIPSTTIVPVASSSYPTTTTRPERWSSRGRSEEHTSELQSLMRILYAILCLYKKNKPILYTKRLNDNI